MSNCFFFFCTIVIVSRVAQYQGSLWTHIQHSAIYLLIRNDREYYCIEVHLLVDVLHFLRPEFCVICHRLGAA